MKPLAMTCCVMRLRRKRNGYKGRTYIKQNAHPVKGGRLLYEAPGDDLLLTRCAPKKNASRLLDWRFG